MEAHFTTRWPPVVGGRLGLSTSAYVLTVNLTEAGELSLVRAIEEAYVAGVS